MRAAVERCIDCGSLHLCDRCARSRVSVNVNVNSRENDLADHADLADQVRAGSTIIDLLRHRECSFSAGLGWYPRHPRDRRNPRSPLVLMLPLREIRCYWMRSRSLPTPARRSWHPCARGHAAEYSPSAEGPRATTQRIIGRSGFPPAARPESFPASGSMRP